MLVQSRSKKLPYVAVSVLVCLYTWVLFLGQPGLPSSWTLNPSSRLPSSSKYPVNEPAVLYLETFDPEPMRSLCSSKEWTPGLYFTCDESVGGIGNIRNSILLCVRYAIEAGAGLVVPTIVLRDANDISLIFNQQRTGMSHLFNTQHFVESLNIGCPELGLYDTVEQIPSYESHQQPITLTPQQLESYELPATGLQHPELWREYFYNWLKDYSTPSVEFPLIINIQRTYMNFPVHHDSEPFLENFGRILHVRDDARRLARKVLERLSTRYSLDIDISSPISDNAFFGVHLRTEHDAVKAWPEGYWEYQRYDRQVESYLQQAGRSNSSVMYVASGDMTEVARFAKDAREKVDLPITTKLDLLDQDDLDYLNQMAWDQQALVDFTVMMKATDFAGISHSSFAWNIALRRHLYSKMKGEEHLDGEQMLYDEFSVVYGHPRALPEYYACMWP